MPSNFLLPDAACFFCTLQNGLLQLVSLCAVQHVCAGPGKDANGEAPSKWCCIWMSTSCMSCHWLRSCNQSLTSHVQVVLEWSNASILQLVIGQCLGLAISTPLPNGTCDLAQRHLVVSQTCKRLAVKPPFGATLMANPGTAASSDMFCWRLLVSAVPFEQSENLALTKTCLHCL